MIVFACCLNWFRPKKRPPEDDPAVDAAVPSKRPADHGKQQEEPLNTSDNDVSSEDSESDADVSHFCC